MNLALGENVWMSVRVELCLCMCAATCGEWFRWILSVLGPASHCPSVRFSRWAQWVRVRGGVFLVHDDHWAAPFIMPFMELIIFPLLPFPLAGSRSVRPSYMAVNSDVQRVCRFSPSCALVSASSFGAASQWICCYRCRQLHFISSLLVSVFLVRFCLV